MFSNTTHEFNHQTFDNLDLQGQQIAGKSFYDCRFTGCNFTETRFETCKFQDCTFHNCDLSLLEVPACSFIAVKFERSKVIGVNWTDAIWGKAGLLNSIDFSGCTLNYSTFSGLKLHEIEISECLAREIDFTQSDLSRANCTQTDFLNSRFWQTNLTGADFTGATNYVIDAGQNTLKGARFSLPEAMALLYSLDIELVNRDEY